MSKKKKVNEQSFQEKPSTSSYWPWFIVFIVIILIALIRIHLLNVPLERDEGEYAYTGQLILQGILPYSAVYSMKMPGIYAVYALILAIFGQTHTAIHLGLMLVNSVAIILVFLLGKRIYGSLTGVMAAASFAVLSLSQSVQGIFTHAEHFVILFAVGGILLLLHAIETNRKGPLFWSGLLLGIGFLMKQHGATFIAFSGFYLLYAHLISRPINWSSFIKKIGLFSIGAFLPFVLTCFIFWSAGLFDKFWFWTFSYAREYVSAYPFAKGINFFKLHLTDILNSSILIWTLAFIGLSAFVWDKKVKSQALFILSFFIFSFLSVWPGFFFRRHYFILLLPAVALLAGIGVTSLLSLFPEKKSTGMKSAAVILLVITPLFFTVYKQKKFFFQMSPKAVSRSTYGFNPFPESLEIAKYIKEQTTEDDRIVVLGSEPQIYFYSKRRSATGYIYTYEMMKGHRYAEVMQKEMIREIESVSPKIIIFASISPSWNLHKDSKRLIFFWFEQYIKKYYERVSVIDILSDEKTVYKWGEESAAYKPHSKYSLFVFKRKK